MFLSFEEKQEIYRINNTRREALLEEARKQSTPAAQIQFVADYFLNKLPKETIAKIDGTSPRNIKSFEYDYSYLDDMFSEQIRKQEAVEYAPGAKAITLPPADDFRVGNEHISIYPTVFTLKMATCIIFANEIQRFCRELGIEGRIEREVTHCSDNFNGFATSGEQIQTDQIVKMMHYYNIITIDGVEYKLDIASALTTLDFNINHPEIYIDPCMFYFSTNISAKPFDDLASAKPPRMQNKNIVMQTGGYDPNW